MSMTPYLYLSLYVLFIGDLGALYGVFGASSGAFGRVWRFVWRFWSFLDDALNADKNVNSSI